MSIPNLPVNFKDDILASSNPKRKYQQTFNTDGSVSLEDVTQYTRRGSEFGASQVNQTNGAVNNIYDERILTLEELALVTEPGYFVDAMAVSDLNGKLPDEGDGYIKFPDGTLIQWGTAHFASGKTSDTMIIDLPVAFANNAYSVSLTKSSNGHTCTNLVEASGVGNSEKTADSFKVTGYFNTTSYNKSFNWQAIGRWK